MKGTEQYKTEYITYKSILKVYKYNVLINNQIVQTNNWSNILSSAIYHDMPNTSHFKIGI